MTRRTTKDEDACAWKRCRRPAELVYLTRPLCQEHWQLVCTLDERGECATVERVLGLKRDMRLEF